MSKLYLIIFIDNYNYSECPPQWKVLSLTDTEYEKINNVIIDFEHTRMPYFYPQMYIYPIEEHKMDDVIEWIGELKQEVVVWQKRNEEREGRKIKRNKEIDDILNK